MRHNQCFLVAQVMPLARGQVQRNWVRQYCVGILVRTQLLGLSEWSSWLR